jgi:hypothetical protein
MKKLAFGALMIGLLSTAACGGGDSPTLIDGAPIDSAVACDPVANTGCPDGQKCTWIVLDQNFETGTLGCAALDPSPVDTDATCQYKNQGTGGTVLAVDNCKGGDICDLFTGTCTAICDSTSATACDQYHSCGLIEGIFSGTTPQYGWCDSLCDPVTQKKLSDAGEVAACGDGLACYWDGPAFTCAGVPTTVTDAPTMYGDQEQTLSPTGSTQGYPNGCQPGYQRSPIAHGTMGDYDICTASCTPAPTYTGNTAQSEGVSPHSCATGEQTFPNPNPQPEDCLYWSGLTSDAARQHTWKDYGFCYDYGQHGDVSCTTAPAPGVDMAGGGMNHDMPNGVDDYIDDLCGPPAGATLTGTTSKRKGAELDGQQLRMKVYKHPTIQ